MKIYCGKISSQFDFGNILFKLFEIGVTVLKDSSTKNVVF
jgi:hypothetical protein